MTDWQPIETAPTDGTLIEVMDPDCGVFPMRWDQRAVNPLVSDIPGLWVASDGSMTWSNQRGYGPTKWRRLTPPCPEAKFKRGDVVKVRRNQAVGHFPPELIVLVAVPPGFSTDDAMADLVGKPRPLMKQVGSRKIKYILCCESGGTVYLCGERDLLPSGKEPVEVGTVSAANENAQGARRDRKKDALK
jgi:hypothetical protein